MNTNNILLIAGLAVALAACKKDKETPAPTAPVATTAAVKLSYTFVHGATPFDPAVPFTDADGRSVRITKLKFYAHDIHLVNDEHTTVAEFHDSIVLVNALNASNEFSLGTMAPGHVHEAEMAFGLDSASTYGYPDQVTAPVPLDDADMTWMWSTDAGRIFIKLEGFVDANGNNEQDAGEGFQYHAIGASLAPVPASFHFHRNAVAGSTFTIGLQVDVAELVGGLGLDGMFHNDGDQVHLLLDNLVRATSSH
ncbi:MAG: hypothetical protein KF797_10900 [Flavobacteriales bacterium]|nr:hypothetical protein [Flavobacteriales bacterium]